MHKTHIFDQKNNGKKHTFYRPTYFFFRPLQETENIFFLALTSMSHGLYPLMGEVNSQSLDHPSYLGYYNQFPK